jgi:hypothetical protein
MTTSPLLTIERGSDRGVAINLTYEAAGLEPAVTGKVILTSELPDSGSAVALSVTFSTVDVDNKQLASLNLTKTQIDLIYPQLVGEYGVSFNANVLVEVINVNDVISFIGSDQIDISSNEPPKFDIEDVQGNDNYLKITVRHTNIDSYNSDLDVHAEAFNIVYSKHGNSGYISITEVNERSPGRYVLTSAIDEVAFTNDIPVDIYVIGTKVYGKLKTDLTGVDGHIAIASNKPKMATNLKVRNKTNGTLELLGNWEDSEVVADHSRYKWGKLPRGSSEWFLDNLYLEEAGVPPKDFVLAIHPDWFNTHSKITVGVTIIQNTAGVDVSSSLQKIQVYSPELPTVSLSYPEVLHNGDQKFTTTSRAKHADVNELTIEYKIDGGNWTNIDTSHNTEEEHHSFTLPYDKFATNDKLKARVSHADLNGDGIRRVETESFTLLRFKDPELSPLTLSGGAVGIAPSANQMMPTMNGYNMTSFELNAFVDKTLVATYFNPAELYEGGLLCDSTTDNVYIAGKWCYVTTSHTMTLDTEQFEGYTEKVITLESTTFDNRVLFFRPPEIQDVRLDDSKTKLIIRGTTNGAILSGYAIRTYALLKSNSDVDSENFEQKNEVFTPSNQADKWEPHKGLYRFEHTTDAFTSPISENAVFRSLALLDSSNAPSALYINYI